MGIGVECIDRIRRDGISQHDIHVTLGRNGVLVSNTDGIYHIRLVPDRLEAVQENIGKRKSDGLRKYRNGEISQDDYIREYVKGTTGAGDVYAATVFFHETRMGKMDLVEVAALSCMNAIKYIGYRQPLGFKDFLLERYHPTRIYKAA